MTVRPERTDDVTAFRRLTTSARQQSRPRNPIWLYPIPYAPADLPDDYIDGYDIYPDWQAPWGNLGPDYPATAFRLVEGKPAWRIIATGGEDLTDSLMFTLPEGFRPARIHPINGRVGELGERVAGIDVHPDGRVIYRGSGVLGDGGVPATSLEGAYLDIAELEAWWRLGESGAWPDSTVYTSNFALDSSPHLRHLTALNRNNDGSGVMLAPGAAGFPERDIPGALTSGDPAINDGGIRFNLNIFEWVTWGAQVAYQSPVAIEEVSWCAGPGAGASVTCWVQFIPTSDPDVVTSVSPNTPSSVGFRPLFGDHYHSFGGVTVGTSVGFDPFYGYLTWYTYGSSGSFGYQTPFALVPYKWYFLAMTVKRVGTVYTRRILLNCVELASASGSASAVGLSDGVILTLGGTQDDDLRFGMGAGGLDEFALFSKALTDVELYHQYTAQVANEGDVWTTTVVTPGPGGLPGTISAVGIPAGLAVVADGSDGTTWGYPNHRVYKSGV